MRYHVGKGALFLVLLVFSICLGHDWPQFRGPNRDGKSAETGLLKEWPEGGPRLLWTAQADLGIGFSHPVIAKGMIYTTGVIGKEGVLFALDLEGDLKWKVIYGPEWYRPTRPGTRSIPTVEGDRVYFFSGLGALYCYDAITGAKKWSLDAAAKYQGVRPLWAWAESPLVVDDKVICTPGGKLATMAALDKITGEVIWVTKDLTDKSAYCSPILVERGGKKIIVTMTAKAVVGVEAANGKILWQDMFAEYQGPRISDTNPISPIYHEDFIYTTSGYDDGGALLELSADGTSVRRKWTDKTLDCHHGNVVLVDGYIYGSNFLSNEKGNWVCLDFETGKVMYETTWHNKGSVIYADGMLYCYEDDEGYFALIKFSNINTSAGTIQAETWFQTVQGLRLIAH